MSQRAKSQGLNRWQQCTYPPPSGRRWHGQQLRLARFILASVILFCLAQSARARVQDATAAPSPSPSATVASARGPI
ncbi:MAG TPA: hypothetical protein VN920_07945, partial [Pyrinomonadaceae bacterium]|nr:hypothetical protein [Pyrinomonadaceae bacterium]